MKFYVPILVAAAVVVPAVAGAQNVTDPQIAAIVVAANQTDVNAGKLAAAKAANAEVKAFGKQMVAAHTSVNKQAVDLVRKLSVTPESNPTSESIKEGGEKNVTHLETLKGAEFDKAYIDNEVAYHQQVLDAMDKILIPGAQNAELKALLVQVRPAFVAHLEHARHLQSTMK